MDNWISICWHSPFLYAFCNISLCPEIKHSFVLSWCLFYIISGILINLFFLYVSPSSGEFSGSNIRLGSRGDSYYEYLIKVWLQQRQSNRTYLHDMYEEAMKGVKHLLVRKSKPNGLVFVGELPTGADGGFSPKMDHLVSYLLSFDVYMSQEILLEVFRFLSLLCSYSVQPLI